MSTRPKRPWQHGGGHRMDGEEGPILIFGIHAVEAALRNRRRPIHAILLTENAEHRLAMVLAGRGIKPQRVTPRALDKRLGPATVHQGALIETGPLPEPALADVAAGGPLLVLDHVTEPSRPYVLLGDLLVGGSAKCASAARGWKAER